MGRTTSIVGALAICGALLPAVAHAQATTRQVPVDSLIYDLKNPDPVRRREAIVQLGINKVQRATPDLVALSSDPDASVRRALVAALAQLADMRSLPGFVTLSGDAERDIRDKAIEGLTNLYLPQESGLVVTLDKVANFFNPWSDEWVNVTIEADLSVDPSAIDALAARLHDADDGLRAKAARSLGVLRGRATMGGLLTVVKEDSSDTARFEAVRALRKIGDPVAAEDLLPLVMLNEPRVRQEVVFTVGRLRYVPAVAELTRLLEREAALSERERDRALMERLLGALAFIGSPESRVTFERYRTSLDVDLRLHAFEGLARLAASASAADITLMAANRLAEKEARVRVAQDFALFRMGRKEHLGPVVEALGSKRTNAGAREYLLELQPAELPDLHAHVSNPDVNVREALAEILGHVGDASSLPSLRDLARDTRGQVSALAAQAIRRIESRTHSQDPAP